MHASELVQVAAIVATHSRLLIQLRTPFPEAAIETYWTACKSRQESWGRTIKQFTNDKQDLLGDSLGSDNPIHSVLEEILTSEPLTRVWAAVCELSDTARNTAAAGPVAENIFAGHLEMRSRVLNLMVYGYGLSVEDSVNLNRLRLRNERCTDTLLSIIGANAARATWAFHPDVVRRTARSLVQRDFSLGARAATSLFMATLTSAYHASDEEAANPELNRRIASSVIACFPPQLFDSTGQFVSSQQHLLFAAESDSRGKINLFQSSPSAAAEIEASDSPPGLRIDFKRFDLR